MVVPSPTPAERQYFARVLSMKVQHVKAGQTQHRVCPQPLGRRFMFSKLIPTLQAQGHEVMTAQQGLDWLAGDVATARSCLSRSDARRSSLDTPIAARSSRTPALIRAW